MKCLVWTILGVCCLAAGCDTAPDSVPPYYSGGSEAGSFNIPEQLEVIGLTAFGIQGYGQTNGTIEAYVGVLDRFDSRVKAPGWVRFELYEDVPRSGQSMGRRLSSWKDVDISDPASNNEHWKDFVRAYRFELPLTFKPSPNASYVLLATWLTPDGRRLNATRQIRYD